MINDRVKKKRKETSHLEKRQLYHGNASRFIRFRTTRIAWGVNKDTPIYRGSVF